MRTCTHKEKNSTATTEDHTPWRFGQEEDTLLQMICLPASSMLRLTLRLPVMHLEQPRASHLAQVEHNESLASNARATLMGKY